MTICTLFDIHYAPQGIALLRSVYRNEGEDARVVVLAMCEESAALLHAFRLPIVWTVNDLPDEYHAKAAALPRAEQCWLATPFLCQKVLHQFGSCEYLDADCFLFAPLSGVRRELQGAAIGIVPHRWDAEHADRLRENGTYNVGYMYWRESPLAVRSVDDWVRWSVAFPTDIARYNDQLFIEDWPKKYRAHVIKHKGVNLAPYNQRQYDIRETENGVTVDGEPLLMYHFHEWGIGEDGEPRRGGYDLSWEVQRYIYPKYEQEIGFALGVLA